jgi:hypothetical protein
MIPQDDLEWLDQKRMEIVRCAERIDQRGHDAPRYLRIIDELIKTNVCFVEIGRLTKENSDEFDQALPER